MPWLRVRYGYSVAFAVPGLFMALALVIFWIGRRHYAMVPPSGPAPHGFLRVVRSALRRAGTGEPGRHWLDGALGDHPADAVEGAKAVFRISGVFASVMVFWALFDQKSSAWVLQSREMDLVVGAFTLRPEQIQVANPFLVMTLIPLLTAVVFPALERRGVALRPLRKMTAGMFLTVLSFAAAAVVQGAIDAAAPEARPSVLWQAPQYVLLTVGEVLVSVTALEFSYTQAPRTMRSTIMSLWYLAVAAGNLLTAVIIKLVPLSGAAYFWFFAALMLVAAVSFRFVARGYEARAAS
jgi:POT family proton-dependent oligopeptide transporter